MQGNIVKSKIPGWMTKQLFRLREIPWFVNYLSLPSASENNKQILVEIEQPIVICQWRVDQLNNWSDRHWKITIFNEIRVQKLHYHSNSDRVFHNHFNIRFNWKVASLKWEKYMLPVLKQFNRYLPSINENLNIFLHKNIMYKSYFGQ